MMTGPLAYKPAFGEIAIEETSGLLKVWNGEKWLDLGTILLRLDDLERRVDKLEARS